MMTTVCCFQEIQFVSDVGGTIGLWIGLSIISFFEVSCNKYIYIFCSPAVSQHHLCKPRGKHMKARHTNHVKIAVVTCQRLVERERERERETERET